MRAPEIARLGEDQIDAGAGVLSRAFHSEPPFLYALPDKAERTALNDRRASEPRCIALVGTGGPSWT